VTVCLDSWAVIAWLDGNQPATARVDGIIGSRPAISWINLAEVYYKVQRFQGRAKADETLADLRSKLEPDLPGTARMVEAARLKAVTPIAFADCFALATAAARGLALWTGDPEILGLDDPPCQLEDIRAA
jgi:predicted nucleic acid-binding protein